MSSATLYLRFWQKIPPRGFTLLETLIALGTLILIGTLAIVSFLNSRKVSDLNASVQNVISILRLAQSKTLAGEDDSQWGVHLAPSEYILFRGSSYPSATLTESFKLPWDIEIANINLATGGSDVIFERVSGTTTNSGTFDLRLLDGSGSIRIKIDGSGKVYESKSSAEASGRITDTRHLSFNLGWSIQNYTTLTLHFYDPPNPDTIFTVTPLSPYFNSNQTKFDWSGTVTVGGQDQVLRIHTTFLDSTNTILSVDRDCRKNTKKLKITFDARDIVTYAADCKSITLEAYGGTVLEP